MVSLRLMLDLQVYVMFTLWRRNVRFRQSSVLDFGYDDRVALPVLDIILAIIVFIARRLLTIRIVALQSALAIIAFVPQINCDRSAAPFCGIRA